MQVKIVDNKLNTQKNRLPNQVMALTPKQNNVGSNNLGSNNVAFTGGFAHKLDVKLGKAMVAMMDTIAAGGFAASFILQDGIGFIAPRTILGLFRGGKIKHDENGNKILDKNGEPKRELNWAFARKEILREVITGPSAFVIPYLMLKVINKKFGRANNIHTDFIDGFKNTFSEYVKNNLDDIKSGKPNKETFYKEVFGHVIEKSVNGNLDASEHMSKAEIAKKAEELAKTQVEIDKINAKYPHSYQFMKRNAAFKELGESVEDKFMALIKNKVGGKADETAAYFLASDNKTVKAAGIGSLSDALSNYFDDATKSINKALKKNSSLNLDDIMKNFTKFKLGSRVLTNVGLFLLVALFYTQIPKLYNMGTNGVNPALANEEDDQPALQQNNKVTTANTNTEKAKDVSFGGATSALGKAGEKVFKNPKLKFLSDIFELKGPIIQGSAMSVLLYGFCIPPRLTNAQDKYDLGEILLRDITAFTALLFGAKALSRVFSDKLTKSTGLALNNKNLEGKKWYQKLWAYFTPSEYGHSVLSSKQLDSKYTNIREYKNQVNGFIEFIEKSGGDIKKAFTHDENIKNTVEEILKSSIGKTYENASIDDIKAVLKEANAKDTELIKKFYSLFTNDNGLLNKAKASNSKFGFLSTLVFVPGLIIFLTQACKYMTNKRKAKEKLAAAAANARPVNFQSTFVPSNKPTMAGFLNQKAQSGVN